MIETEEYKKAVHEWVVSGDAIDLVPILVEEVKRLREQMQLLHDTWFADEEMASDVDERMTTLLKEMNE